jgi:hypothetical protein
MSRLVDLLSVLFLIAAIACFSLGIHALSERRDLGALYWLVVGALVLRAATDMLRPRASSR